MVKLQKNREEKRSSSHHGRDDAGEGKQMEGFTNLITAMTVGNLIEGQLLPYLVAHAMEGEAKKS